MPPVRDDCLWAEDEDGVWHTRCGKHWVFVDGEREEAMRFCCYCGKPLHGQPYVEPAEEEEDDA